MNYVMPLIVVLILGLPVKPSIAFSSELLTVQTDSSVNSCLILADKKKLVGTHSGLLFLNNSYSLIKAWNAANGLPGTRVYALLPLKSDPKKNKFSALIGTENGLALFSGTNGTYDVTPVFNGLDIRLLFDSNSTLYAGTWGEGLFSLDSGFKPRKINYSDSATLKQKYRITAYTHIDNTLYIATAGSGIYQLNEKTLVPSEINSKLPSPVVFSMAAFNNELWAGTLGGLVTLSNKRVIPVSTADIRELTLKNNTLYAGSFTRGILTYTHPYNPKRMNPLEQPLNVNSLVFDNDTLLVCSKSGLWVHRKQGFQKQILTIPFSKDIAALASDEKSGLWIGTFDQGLYYMKDKALSKFNDPMLDKQINALAYENHPDAPRLWIGTTKGLFLLKNNALIHVTKSNGIPAKSVLALTIMPSGGVLAGLGRSAAIITEKKTIHLGEKEGVPNRSVSSVCSDKAGNLWLGTTIGLFQYRTDEPVKRYSVAAGHFKNGWITALGIHKDYLWCGTYNSGISKIALNNSKQVTHLGGGYINPAGLCFYKNYLYAATMSGLKRFNIEAKHGKWDMIKKGVPGSDVTSIVVSGTSLWVGTRRGLNRIPITDLKN